MAAPKKSLEPVEIDTAKYKKPVGRTSLIRIGGTVFEAHCPKDAVLAQINSEDLGSFDTVTRVIAAMIGRDGGEKVVEMLEDPDNDEVSLMTLSSLIRFLMEDPEGPRWGEALTESLKSLGSGETPRTIPVRRTSAPARAPRAAKRTAAKR